MLIITNRKDKNKSKYICDRCKKEITTSERKGIYVRISESTNPKKKWDLCINCYKSLERGIARETIKKQGGYI